MQPIFKMHIIYLLVLSRNVLIKNENKIELCRII